VSDEPGRKGAGVVWNFAVLATQIANLTGSWGGDIAGGIFAALVRIKMRQSAGAVAVGRNGECMEVVHCGHC